MSKETIPKKVKQQQIRNIVIVGAVVMLGSWGLYELISDDNSSKPTQAKTATTVDTKFTSPLEHIDSEKVWNERVENKVSDALKKSEEAKQQLVEAKTNQAAQLNQSQQLIQQMSQQMTAMQQQIDALKSDKLSSVPVTHDMPPVVDANGYPIPSAIAGIGIREDSLKLIDDENIRMPFKNPDTYVPSGTFVKAVMLGGADAPAAVTSQSNPKPMVFRVMEQGTLPNHRKSHLKDCTVTAAVAGDISSERGEVRLETLSCVKSNGGILDIPVQGTVFGRDGKSGVRGTAVWREGALIQRAAGAGVLSGFSDALSQKYTTTSISPLGSTQSVDNNAIWQYGAARGASNAMSKLADYYVQRAEQYHPVIQLSAGDTVDVVFLKGFYLDGNKHDENQENQVQPISQTNAQSTQGNSPLPLTEKQVQRLKERQRELGLSTQKMR
jgi:conjugal transfer pilus assembly protein TraB